MGRVKEGRSRKRLEQLSQNQHLLQEGQAQQVGEVKVKGTLPTESSVTLHTDVGDIKIEVFCERTPKACENFLALCASNYYNGCIFHRNIKGFMVQTGDPTGTGRGGNSIWSKKFEDEYSEYLKHSVRGVVSMANNGPNTNGSQFFITYGKQPHLDMKYTVFGKVIDGLETLDELEKLPVNEKTYRPLNDVHIKDITIHANPFAQ
ncbi:Peptidyl-prolyl cis-trans isomerase-like 3 [Pteropus alecto]|uniref:Peptidyl-prolyl cis-trans isomerase n=1 Tax=Pteropus alecto TaxID=9402 RepID=L5K2W0_PTEAL|nr:Peptidyl-prolyl cis-trans isomerase-like 3 [Pteropus alecto]